MNFRLFICKNGGRCRGKWSLIVPFRSKPQLVVHTSPFQFNTLRQSYPLRHHGVADLSPLVVTTIQDSDLRPNFYFYSSVSLVPFSGHLLPLDEWGFSGFSGFDPQGSLKDLVCTNPLALIPEHVRKTLPSHLPLTPGIQD